MRFFQKSMQYVPLHNDDMTNEALGPVCTDEAIFGPGATWVN